MQKFGKSKVDNTSVNLQLVTKEGMKQVEVHVGDRIWFNWGGYHSGDAGTVQEFQWNEFYERYEAIVKIDEDGVNGLTNHVTDRIVEYGIGGYLERLGGEGIYAKK